MNEPNKNGSVKALKGLIKKPAARASVEDMNEVIRIAACASMSTDDKEAAKDTRKHSQNSLISLLKSGLRRAGW
ncbi:hypothetical protein ACRS3X_07755 [Ectopseudomonas hydrolytica]|uniref:hypothetical protein n=1 Tax=Ectopseudomonas hydrolytica TaxID=2493633 RepID=UPI003EE41510